MTLNAFRSQFRLPDDTVYLDHAATGVLSESAHSAAADFLAGRAGHVPGRMPNNFPVDLERIERARQRAATLVGADVSQTALVPNTSYGLNLVAQGLDWQPGDRVAVPGCEFPSNLLPWRALHDRDVVTDAIPHRDGAFTLDDIEATLRPETRVVAVSAVQFLSGFRCDLAAIGDFCRQRGILFVVDGIQGVGAVRIDVQEIQADLLAVGGHKWLGSMQGAGFVAVSPHLMERVRPLRGWLNGPVDWDDFERVGLELHPDATRFHVGTFPTAALYALDAAVGVLLDVGPEQIENAVLANSRQLAAGMDRLGVERVLDGEPQSGIVTVRVDEPEPMHQALMDRRIVCSMRSRLLRFAPHAWTSPAEIDAALAVVEEVLPVAA